MKKINSLIILTFVFLIFYSCQQTDSVYVKPKREYKEILCPKCEGTGTVPQSTSQKVGYAIVTFGMTLMCDDEQTCPKCHGKGFIKVPVLNDTIIIE